MLRRMFLFLLFLFFLLMGCGAYLCLATFLKYPPMPSTSTVAQNISEIMLWPDQSKSTVFGDRSFSNDGAKAKHVAKSNQFRSREVGGKTKR
jgi:hypothetical protein